MRIITRKIGPWFQDKGGILSRDLMSSVDYHSRDYNNFSCDIFLTFLAATIHGVNNFNILISIEMCIFLNIKENVTIVKNIYYSKY